MLDVLYFLCGSFTMGQMVLIEVGKYEVWTKKRRLITGIAIGVFTTIALYPLSKIDLGLYTAAIISSLIIEKMVAKILNSKFPRKFQAEQSDLKEKYGGVFKIDDSEIEGILKEEEVFLKKLGLMNSGEAFREQKDIEKELEELRKAIQRYIEKEKNE